MKPKCKEKECFVNKNKEEYELCVMCKRSFMNKHMKSTKVDNFLTHLQRYGY